MTTPSHHRTPLAPLSANPNLRARFSRGTELAAGCSLCSYRAEARPAPAPKGCWFAAWWPGAFGGDDLDDDLGLDDDDDLGL